MKHILQSEVQRILQNSFLMLIYILHSENKLQSTREVNVKNVNDCHKECK